LQIHRDNYAGLSNNQKKAAKSAIKDWVRKKLGRQDVNDQDIDQEVGNSF
jgi:hypothetical protein